MKNMECCFSFTIKKKKKEIEFYQTEKVSYSDKTHLEVLMIK